jgi:hypothetical protein
MSAAEHLRLSQIPIFARPLSSMLMTEGRIYRPGCTQRSASALTSRPAQGERDQPGAIDHIELKSENDDPNGANFCCGA